MKEQLALLPSTAGGPRPDASRDDTSWELDDHTREIGKQGLAAARQALRQAGARRAA